jgi:hypothetical protein
VSLLWVLLVLQSLLVVGPVYDILLRRLEQILDIDQQVQR